MYTVHIEPYHIGVSADAQAIVKGFGPHSLSCCLKVYHAHSLLPHTIILLMQSGEATMKLFRAELRVTHASTRQGHVI